MKNVYILGGESFGTAFGNQLASNKNNKVVLFVRSEIQEKEINESHSNKKYFPNKTLNPSLSATSKENDLSNADLIFISIPSKKMTTILTYGTFDLLHYGHIEILRRAKELGDRLVVGLSTDDFNKTKEKKCEIPYEKRKEFLESIGYVDLVIPESSWDQKKKDIVDNEIDILLVYQ